MGDRGKTVREERAVREAGPYRWEKAGCEFRGGVKTPPYGRGKNVREEGRADMESAPTDGGGLAVSLPQSLRDSRFVREARELRMFRPKGGTPASLAQRATMPLVRGGLL